MTELELKRSACDLVALEAQYLDEQDWTAWLDLYCEDAVFWMPTWRSDAQLTSDPMTELSFIYLDSRKLLAERVFRLTSGRSVASMPMPRTTHLVTGSLATLQPQSGAGTSVRSVRVKSAWSSHIYQHKDTALTTYAGRYEHDLVYHGEVGRIARKKIVLSNDHLLSKVDFFYI